MTQGSSSSRDENSSESIEMEAPSKYRFTETSSISENKRKDDGKTFLKIVGVIALVGVIVMVIILPVYFEVIAPNSEDNDVVTSAPNVPENDRFDCFPEGGATAEACMERGCVWTADVNQPDSPSCFYSGSDGYEMVGQANTANGFRVELRKRESDVTVDPYGEEFASLLLTVTFMTEDTVRIKIEPTSESRYEVPWTHNDPSPSITEDDLLYKVDVDTTPSGLFGFKVTRKSTNRVLFDTTVGRMMFADQFLQISTLLPSQYVYGFGEHMHETLKHDLNWKSHGMFSRDQGVGPNVNLYGVHPYYTCMEGDGNAHGVFILNSNAQDISLQPTPALTYRTIGGLFDIYMFLGPEPETVVSQYTSVVGRPYMPPYWALGFQLCRYGYGSLENLKTVVDRNLATDMPYDVQYSDIDYMDRQLDFTINSTTYDGLENYTRELQNVHQMRYIIILDPAISGNETAGTYPPYDLGLEQDVFMSDPNGNIAWGKVWPDLPGIYVNTTWDFESQTETFRAWTAFPDFFKQQTKDWWRDEIVKFHDRIEFDGLWIDMNEPASFVHGSPSNTCPDSKWDNPLPYFPKIAGNGVLYDKTTCMGNLHNITESGVVDTHYNMHSLYGWSQSKPTLDSCREATGERCMVISRSTFPGSGKYVGHWLGDNTSIWPHLAASIIGMIEFNFFGIPYIGADICGFFQDTNKELCMRWMQLGAFYPFNRNHNGLGFKDQDPAVFGEDFVAASKKVLDIRYSILPYFYTLFYDAHVKGSTVVRSLMAEFPNDLNTYEIDRQMLLGGEILITPVLEPDMDTVVGYVPDARWYDFYTGMEVPEELRMTEVELDAPWDHIPIHVRGGSIIPSQTPAKTTDIQRSNPLGVFYAMGDGVSSGHLFWDDGDSIDTIENMEYVLVNFAGTQNSLSLSVEYDGYPEASNMTFDQVTVMGVAEDMVTRVFVNGSPHTYFNFNTTTKTLRITGLNLPLTFGWNVTWDADRLPDESRFDCFPEGDATPEACMERGCIWSDDVSQPEVPSCYYSGSDGYDLVSQTNTANGFRVELQKRVNPESKAVNPYGEEFANLLLTVTFVTEDTVRIKIEPTSESRYEVPWTHNDPSSSITEDDLLYKVDVDTTPSGLFGFKVMRKSTNRVLFDTTVGRMMFADQFLQISTLLPSQYIYGFGEHMRETLKHDLNWKSHGMFSRDQGVGLNVNLYGVHPYYTCMEGDGNAHGVFFLNSNAQDISLQPTPALTYRTIGGLFDIYMFLGPEPETVVSQYTSVVGRPYMPPYWALGFQLCRYGYGSLENLKTVVDRNLATDMPYDVQYSDIDYMDRQLDFTINSTTYDGLENYTRELQNVHQMRYIIILDPAISGNETVGSYPPYDIGIEQDVFMSDPDGYIAWGKVWPDLPGIYVNTTWDWEDQTETFRAWTAFPDFFKQQTKDWWRDEIVKFHDRIEFDGLWIDMNEPASFVHGSPSNTCPDSKWDNPLPYFPKIEGNGVLYDKTTCMGNLHNITESGVVDTHYNMHSLYGWSQSKPTLDSCREATGERCMVISRSTFPGSGKYVGHWLGDNTSIWPHLAASIIGMIEFNFFGIPYIGADICGFFQDTNEELCMRWMQLGAFYPFNRNHNGLGFKDQDPAVFGEDFVAASKKVLDIRYSILPYFYTLFYDAHVKGSTVVRSLMAEFPNDLETYEIDRQMLLGGEILITPVLEPDMDTVVGYVPDARWYDFYTGMEVPAELRMTEVELDAPWDHIPIHVRGGSIIPSQTPAKTTDIQRSNPLGVFYAMGDGASSGHLFWDDGDSIDTIEKKECVLVHFAGTQNSLSLSVKHDGYPEASNMTFDQVTVMGVAEDMVTRVFVNGSPHTYFNFNTTTKTLRIIGLNLPLTSAWNVTWDADRLPDESRFDCFPEGDATPEACMERGCIWSDDVSQPEVPSCYYSGSDGYDLVSQTNTANGFRVELQKRVNPESKAVNPYGEEFANLLLTVTFVTEDTVRIKIEPTSESRYEVPWTHNDPSSSITEDDLLYKVDVDTTPSGLFGFKVTRKSTNRVLFDTTVGRMMFADQFLQISTLLPSQYIYGFGEHMRETLKHDLNWKSHGMFSRDQGVGLNVNLYGVHPYYTCMEGDGNAHGVFFLNSNAQDISLQPTPALTYRTIGGLFDIYMFLGPEPETVVSQYTSVVGRPYMPPYWALGFQLCRYGYGSLENLKTVVDRNLATDMPYDVQYSDIDYMDRQLDFTINSTTYDGLENYTRELQNVHQMRYIIILDPAISGNETVGSYPPYDIGIEQDVFMSDPDGNIAWGKVWPDLPGIYVNTTWDWEDQTETFRAWTAFPDFFKQQTKDWWRDEIVKFHDRIEFDGLWIDMNEPASFVHGSPTNTCPDSKWDNPLPYFPKIEGNGVLYDKTTCMGNLHNITESGVVDTHYNMHSLYGWSQSKPTLDSCREATGERCMVISRSTFPGSGKYVGHWLGDNTSKWSHLAASIIGMIDFNFFGIPYIGADICGFFEDTTEELCMRWMQLGAFYPFSRNHNSINFKDQDPAVFGEDFVAASKKVLDIRYSILPYFYTLFYDAHVKGSTVVRSLMAEFPTDLNTYEIDRQMLLGGEILITPVLESGKETVVGYVPDARWYDFYTGMEVPEELRMTEVELDAPWDHIPIHVRGGSIIPSQTPAKTTDIQRSNPLGVFYAMGDGVSSGHLFWDDGDSIDTIENMEYVLVNFAGTQNSLSLSVERDGYPEASNMRFDQVTVMGAAEDMVRRVFANGLPHFEFTFNTTTKVLQVTGLNLPLTSAWNITWDSQTYFTRFDCQPETKVERTEEECTRRQCVWDEVSEYGVPSCYYPSNYGLYSVDGAPIATENGEEISLNRRSEDPIYNNPVDKLKVEVEMQSEHQLRIKISDPNSARYEVPMTVAGAVSGIPNNPLYDVTYEDNPFSFKVIRKSTGEVIMDTSVGGFIFEDQFLQISSRTASSFMYGLGEAEHANYLLDFYWSTQPMFSNGDKVEQNANLYGHHPYHMTMEQSGNAHGVLLLNSNAMEISLTPLPAVTYRTIGGILDFYLFLGPTPEDVVQQYSAAVGLPMMPPYWALGFQLCKYDYGGIDNLTTVVEEMRNYSIPYDVQYGDIDYMERQLDFTVDSEAYNGLSQFVDTMRNDYNMRYVIILDPAISANETDYPAYDEGVVKDVFIKTSTGEILYNHVWPGIEGTTKLEPETYAHVAFPDFFKNATSDWWNEQIVDFYKNQLKFDGLWIDMNEPDTFYDGQLNEGGCPANNRYDNPPYFPSIRAENIVYDNTICLSSVQDVTSNPDNDVHYNLHSLYGWSQAEPTVRACRNATGKRCYVIGRSTYPGAGKYEGHWLGDNTSKWPHLRSSIIQMFEFSLFGFSYTGADICGFFEDAEQEMCLRWSQLGAFYPFSRNHAMRGTRRQDPAAWGDEFAFSVRDTLNIRYTLLPYLYTLFYHSHTQGSTVVRPIMHEFTSDRNTWELDRQFLWGPALMISPVLEAGQTTVDVYVPDARWFDYYTNQDVMVRKTKATLSAPMDHINLHMRGGYILPAQQPATTTYASRQNNFILYVALDDNMEANGDLFWDDGESVEIAVNNYLYTTFHSTGYVLENRIVHNDFDDAATLMIDDVIIMGLLDNVTRVLSNNQEIPFQQDSNSNALHLSSLQLHLGDEFSINWEVNSEWSRFDCLPDLLEEPNQSECERRGCLWRTSTTPGVPQCFYSSDDLPGYRVTSTISDQANEASYQLERIDTPSMYGGDINSLKFDVEYQTDHRLHFKISDPNNDRWEIDESMNVLDADNSTNSNKDDASYQVAVEEDPFRFIVSRKDTNEVMFDSGAGAFQFADQFLQISTFLPSYNVYGFGEHNHRRYRHDFNWRRWALFTRDVAPVDDWNLYGMQTFFMSMMSSNDGKSFGLYLHNTNAMDVLLQPTPALTYRITGGVLDFYLFVGNSPEEVVQEYHKLIGHPVMPPYWALGFQLSRWDYGSLDRVKEVVQEMRDAEIPFDVQYGDIDYMDAKKSFTYDQVLYNGLPEFVDDLHDWGMRYIIILDPGIKIEEGYLSYDRGIDQDIFIKTPEGENLVTEVWPGDTYHPDYTHPNALDWWRTECAEFYQTVKYDALWIDMNEPANFQPDDPDKLEKMNCTGPYNFPPYMPRILGYWVGLHDKSFCMDNTQYAGLHYNVHSLYGHSMSYVTYDTLKDVFPDKRSLVLTRSTFAGTGKYAQHWLGDNQSRWPQMSWSIPAMFEFNLFGFPYIGADICGFYFNTTAEMCQRWMQVGAFYPFSRNHNAAEMIPQHPTVFGEEVISSSKKALNIRYSILPYMYTWFYHVHMNGGTLVRALVHEFPSDQNTWNQDRQFLLGPAFLVTPVLDEGVTKVTGYFPPASRWFDFHTWEEVENVGKFVSLDAPMDHINLHIRGGYILPMQDPKVTTAESRTQNMSLLVALDSNDEAMGDLFWDDGESRNVSENYALLQFGCSENQLSISLQNNPTNLPEIENLFFYKVSVLGLSAQPVNVTLNSEEIPFDFNSDVNALIIDNLEISMVSTSNVIAWTIN